MISLLRDSLVLDFKLLAAKHLPLSFWQKIRFISNKYQMLLMTLFVKRPTHHRDTLFGGNIFYESRYGSAGIQRMLVSQFEPIMQYLVDDDENSGMVVVDIGANVGSFSMLALKFLDLASLTLIEPDAVVIGRAQENMSVLLNFIDPSKKVPQIKFINEFVGEPGSRVRFFTSEDKPYVNSAMEERRSEKGFVERSITSVSIDSLLVDLEKIDLLKIDVEGWENRVLHSGRETLRKTKFLILEVSRQDRSFSSLMSFLRGDDYDFELLYVRNLTGRSEGSYSSIELILKNIRVSR